MSVFRVMSKAQTWNRATLCARRWHARSLSPFSQKRNMTGLRFLRMAWRPSPMPDPQDQFTPEEKQFRRRSPTSTVIVLGITTINVYVWYRWQLATAAAGRGERQLLEYMNDNFTCSRRNYNEGRWWTIVTSGFSHQAVWHLLANGIGILSFYPLVSIRLGIVRGLTVYLGSIIGGSVASLYNAGQWQGKTELQRRDLLSIFATPVPEKLDLPGLGASAGVCGLLTLSTILNPTLQVSIFFIPFPAWVAFGMLTGFDMYCALSREGRQKAIEATGIHIGHEAHLGGSGTALALAILLMPRFWLRGGR